MNTAVTELQEARVALESWLTETLSGKDYTGDEVRRRIYDIVTPLQKLSGTDLVVCSLGRAMLNAREGKTYTASQIQELLLALWDLINAKQ